MSKKSTVSSASTSASSSQSDSKSQASESSRGESKPTSSRSKSADSNRISLSDMESPMSVSVPSHIRETETWRAHRGILEDIAPKELPDNIEAQVIRPFEQLTGTNRFAELEQLLQSNTQTAIDPTCVRNTSNWATIEKHHKFDKPEFNAAQTAKDIAKMSPKLKKILQNIRKLDREDEVRYGRKFKHFIFSDIKGPQGAKAVAAGLLSEGYNLSYNVHSTGKKTHIKVKSNEELLKTKGANFFLLSSISIYGEPLLVSVKKDVLKKFNSRPDNVYGDLARIIVMDSGFKEGIDLFDIKYIHIFEPQTTIADQKQVIGRGTRTCGQKGLQFQPQMGWPLYVFKYDLSIAPEYTVDFHGAESAFQYYLQSKNIDIRLLNLMSNLENLAIKGSVDYKLNKPIHEFSSDGGMRGGSKETEGFARTPERISGATSVGVRGLSREDLSSKDNGDVYWGGDSKEESDGEDEEEEPPKHMRTAEENLMRKLSEESRPGNKHRVMQKYIKKYFSKHTWPPVKMENLCGYEGPKLLSIPLAAKSAAEIEQKRQKSEPEKRRVKSVGGATPNLITLSPTQDFISSYFTAENPIKGMVLWQSVGTGKTCTAIATATRQFEPLGYTILWVTRTTLKNDIWKNMFEMVCHKDIRDKVEAGVHVPDDMPGRMRLLSKSWGIRPISYKQFSNLVSKNNQYYDQLVKRNGEEDPLRKTLLIIDEAHKLYGGGDLSSIERPDMTAFQKALMNSYAVSGKDSVRVLFMTATPITESPLELVKLVNLCKPQEDQIPTEFGEFADTFLDDTGDFTAIGEELFLDKIAGHISYLNREGDVRQFSRPILREVAVPLVDKDTAKDIEDFDVVGATELDRRSEELRKIAEDAKTKYDTALEGFTKGNKAKVERVCNEYPENDRGACYKFAKKYTNRMIKTAKIRANEWKAQMTDLKKRWQESKKVKSNRFKFVHQTRKDNAVDFEEYKKSTYYKLKGCEKEWKDVPKFDQFLESQPAFSQAKNLEEAIKDELKTVENRLNADLSSQQSRIRSYNKLLKTELTLPETQVVRSVIATAKTKLDKTKKRNMKWMKRMTKRADMSIERLSKFQKKVKREIRSVVKEQLKEDNNLAKEEKKGRKLEETADKDLTDTFRESLAEAQNAVKVEMDKRINKQAETEQKATMREEKKTAAATRKLEKARAAEEKKAANVTRKQQVAFAKEAKKAHKATEKEAAKKQKEDEKAQKAAEKEAAKNAKKK